MAVGAIPTPSPMNNSDNGKRNKEAASLSPCRIFPIKVRIYGGAFFSVSNSPIAVHQSVSNQDGGNMELLHGHLLNTSALHLKGSSFHSTGELSVSFPAFKMSTTGSSVF